MDAVHVYFTVVIASFFSLLFNRRYIVKSYWYFFALLSIVILAEGAMLLKLEILDGYLHNVYYLAEIVCLSLIYRIFLNNSIAKRLIPWIIVMGCLIFIINIGSRGLGASNEPMIFYNNLVITIFSLIYFYESFSPPFEKTSIYRSPFFWINCGNLFFYAGTLMHGTLNYLSKNMSIDQQWIMYYISTIFNQSLYILYFIGFSSKRLFK